MKPEELLKIREQKQLTKKDMAALLGVTAMLYGRYEKGSCAIPEEIAEKLKAADDARVATEIEVKKNTRKAARKAKETVEEAAVEVAEAVDDKRVAEEIEVKKTVRKAARKVKKAVEILIESRMGGQISPEEIVLRVPEGVEKIFIKPEENKAYWVKGDETGAVELW